jgi:hypothetical protein
MLAQSNPVPSCANIFNTAGSSLHLTATNKTHNFEWRKQITYKKAKLKRTSYQPKIKVDIKSTWSKQKMQKKCNCWQN